MPFWVGWTDFLNGGIEKQPFFLAGFGVEGDKMAETTLILKNIKSDY